MTMSIGMNTNVEYKGKVYHVQTEDGGLDHPTITTLLFKEGAVFASKRTDYKKFLESPSCRETVTEMMKEQHKAIIHDLVAGKITCDAGTQGSFPDQGDAQEALGTPPEMEPSQERNQKTTGKEKDLDDLIIEYLAEKNKEAH